MALESLLEEEKEWAQSHRQHHSLSNMHVPEHHAKILTEQADDQIVNQEGEETRVREMAEEHGVDVAFVKTVWAESEVVHVAEHVIGRPEHVKTV